LDIADLKQNVGKFLVYKFVGSQTVLIIIDQRSLLTAQIADGEILETSFCFKLAT